jgi:hypothetical protein
MLAMDVASRLSFDGQVGFRWDQDSIGGLSTKFVGLFKREENGL